MWPSASEQIEKLADLAAREGVKLTIVGPEVPLVAGIVDLFATRGLPCFGPRKAPAQLEGSKAFTKEFLQRHRIPTAGYRRFTRADFDRARGWPRSRLPIVVKASGLAAGKGVIIAQTAAEAVAAAESMLRRPLRRCRRRNRHRGIPRGRGSQLHRDERWHATCCPWPAARTTSACAMPTQGPNTGGMGAYSPAPVVTAAVHERIMREVIEPTIAGCAADGMPFVGFLYAGLMIDATGAPKVIEYNVRFGDPETQPVLARLKSDLTVLCEAALAGRLDTVKAEWDPRAALGVVMAAQGYPDEVRKGDVVAGLDQRRRAARQAVPCRHRQPRTARWSLPAAACSAPWDWAPPCVPRSARPTHWSMPSRSMARSARRDIGYRAIAREERR